MYDYVNKGDFLGEVKDNILYLVFEKDGVFLNYKEYIWFFLYTSFNNIFCVDCVFFGAIC